MFEERWATVATVYNGAMIAYTSLLADVNGVTIPLEESTCTQRFRPDEKK